MGARGAAAEFKEFVLRGNVVELAVAVAIGAAFGRVVSAFTENLLTPLLAIPGDAADLSDLDVEVGGSVFSYGVVVNAVISFVIILRSAGRRSVSGEFLQPVGATLCDPQ